MPENRNNTVHASFVSFLESKGMRETYERKAILQTILEMSKSFDYSSLADSLKSRGEQICRATIFNTLSLLIDSGILRRQHFADGQINYELTAQLPSGNQLHLLCTSCGKISDLRNSQIIRELRHMKFGTFLPSYLSLTVYGLCSKCQKKNRTKTLQESIQLNLFK
ncbi:MAG: transcriptional repressor [Bacteroidales bacterium]|nr:transcriptional repressor [Bacteroidales bacterium]